MVARLIVIEGIDQSGKNTQTKLLSNKLRRQGYITKILSFPIYTSPSGRELRRFLQGKRQNLPVQAVHMLYSLNRWENLQQINEAMDTNDFVIMDRYVPSNLAYGIGKGLNAKWLSSLDEGLPEPDIVIILDVPANSSFNRKHVQRDVHEKNKRYLEKVAAIYRRLAQNNKWMLVNGNLSSGQVNTNVWKIVSSRFRIHQK